MINVRNGGERPLLNGFVACAVCLSVPSIHAQSSVGVQGIVDVSGRVVRNDATRWTLSNDGVSGSQLVFRGNEDLGGGLSAGFWLEAGLQLDTGGAGGSNGTTTAFFNRRSTVYLSSTALGQVRLGRDYTPTYWNIAKFDPLKTNGVANANNLEPTTNSLGSSAFTLIRANNSIAYFSPPSLGKVFVHAMVAAGEGSPGGKYTGLRVGLTDPGYEVAISTGSTQGDALNNKFDVRNVGGTYDFKFIKPMAFFQRATFKDRRQDNWLVGFTAPIGLGEFRTSYQHANQSGGGTDANDASQVGIGYAYFLSKRTAVYATGSEVTNKGKSTYVASSSGGPLTPGTRSRALEFGIQHTF